MAITASAAEPTFFHRFLATLHKRGTLRRIYSQNIDCLELKSGLNCRPMNDQHPICVPLHGTLEQLRCSSCQSCFLLEAYQDVLSTGIFPQCVNCETTAKERAHKNLRNRKTVAYLRPDIILFGEEHPYGEDIMDIQTEDMQHVDLLLVVGTSMKIPGILKTIRQFSQTIKGKHGNRKFPSGSIYINKEIGSKEQCCRVFDIWLEGDCQEFAITMLKQMDKVDKGGSNEEGTQLWIPTNILFPIENAYRRLDIRSLRTYY